MKLIGREVQVQGVKLDVLDCTVHSNQLAMCSGGEGPMFK